MRAGIAILVLLVAVPAVAQDTTAVDLAALRERGVPAEIRSKTTKRNPETGRSTIALIEAYTRGLIVDEGNGLVLFVSDADDLGWVRPNAVALLESAEALIRTLDAEGREAPVLAELDAKWFPRIAEEDDEQVVRRWEEGLLTQGVPVVVSRFDFRVSDEGDVHPSFGVKNISRLTLAGVMIELVGFNQYGDVVRDRSTGMATHYARLDATVRPGDAALTGFTDRPLWSNRSTSCIELRKVTVTFQDGSTASVDYQLKDARMAPDTYRTMGECSRPGSGP